MVLPKFYRLRFVTLILPKKCKEIIDETKTLLWIVMVVFFFFLNKIWFHRLKTIKTLDTRFET